MSRPLSKLRISTIISIALVATYVFAANGPYPSVGLYWLENTDPTASPGVIAPLNQLLIRTDMPSLYYKSGNGNQDWTQIGAVGGGGGGGTVTSIACGAGLTCSPSPITSSGTISANLTGTGTANQTTKWTGAGTIGNGWATDNATTWGVAGKFAITEATGATLISSTLHATGVATFDAAGSFGGALDMTSHLINNVVDPVSPQDAATKAYVDASTASGITGSLTTGQIPVASGAHTLINGSWTDVAGALSTPATVNYTLNNTNSASTVWTLHSTLEPSSAQFGLAQAEVSEPGPYNDKTMRLGYNLTGSGVSDPTQQALGLQWESKYDDDGAGPDGYQSEFHLFTIDTSNVEHRWITGEAKWDGSEGGLDFKATNATFLAWNGDFVGRLSAATASAAIFNMQASTYIKSDSASNVFNVHKLTGDVQLFRVGNDTAEADLPFAISTSNAVPLVINGTGAKNIEIDAGAKTLNVSMQANGAATFENRATTTGTTDVYNDGTFTVRDYNLGQTPRLAVTSTDTRVFGNERFGSAGFLGWSSATANSAPDVALSRAAANILEADTGTAGAYAIVRGADPVNSHDFATMGWVGTHAGGGITNNVVPKGNGTGLTNSSRTDTGTAVSETLPITSTLSSAGTYTPYTLVNSGAGGINLAFSANGGTKTGFISFDSAGNLVNRAAAGVFDDLGAGALFHVRNSSFADLFTVAEATGNVVESGTLQVASYVGFTGTPVVGQRLTVNTSAADTIGAIVNNSSTSSTVGKALVYAQDSGSIDTTAGAINTYGMRAHSLGTRSAGSNALTNIALELNAANAQSNIAILVNGGTSSLLGMTATTGAFSSTLTADSGLRVFDIAGTGLTSSANTVSLSLNGGAAQTCGAGNFVSAISATGITTCTTPAGGGTVTGTGTANTTTKWTGTSSIGNGWALDDGTTWGVSGKFAILEASGAIGINASPNSGVMLNGVQGSAVATGIDVTDTQIGSTTNRYAYRVDKTNTLDTTAGALNNFGHYISIVSSISAGANVLTNYGIYSSVSGATTNYDFYGATGLFFQSGPATMNTTLVVGGASNSNSTFITAAGTGQTATIAAVNAVNSGTFDATAAARTTYGVFASVSATRSAGANALTNVGASFAATGAQTNIALQTTTGIVTFNGTVGLNTTGSSSTRLYNEAASADAIGYYFHNVNTSSTLTVRAGMQLNDIGTYDTTTAAAAVYGVRISNTASRSAGANALTDYGLYVDITGAQSNYAFYGNNGLMHNASAVDFGSTLAVTSSITADSGLRVFDIAGTGLTSSANTVSLSLNGGAAQTCGAGNFVSAISATGITTCTTPAGGGGNLSGTLTSGTMPIATGANTLGDSGISNVGGYYIYNAASVSGHTFKANSATLMQIDPNGNVGATAYFGVGTSGSYTFSTSAASLGTVDARFVRGGTNAVTLDNGAGGSATLTVTAGITADSGNRVLSAVGTGLSKSTNTVSLAINGGTTQTCSVGSFISALTGVGIATCTAGGTGTVTGTGTTNQLAKWTGTSSIGSSLTSDDGTNLTTGDQFVLFRGGAITYTGLTNDGVVNYDNTAHNLVIAAQYTSGPSAIDLAVSNGGAASNVFELTPSTTSIFNANLNISGLTTISNSLAVTGLAATNAIAVTSVQSGAAASIAGVISSMAGTFNTTSLDRTATGVYGLATATRSTGSNNVINIGLRGTASGGQINRALETEFGDVWLNSSSGTATIGPGTDASSAGVAPELYVSLNGATNISARDSTDHTEIAMGANNLTTFIGSQTATSMQIQTNKLTAISIDTSQNIAVSGTTSTNGLSVGGNVVASFTGEIRDTGSSASISSCGTTPTVVVGARSGSVTVGTTGIGCTITFGGSGFTTASHCYVQAESGTRTFSYTSTNTALVISSATPGIKYDFICTGT